MLELALSPAPFQLFNVVCVTLNGPGGKIKSLDILLCMCAVLLT